ncbi:Chromatin modification-related protein [Mycena chlorophos]|uniref:Chromatin modification-related protein n=1 Tax=Mycena chlorophos TaxID=658473 RepID=A0A8H6WD95_MYCCL|nr:Chromatin modification-related protein [Mycena chlorophos]
MSLGINNLEDASTMVSEFIYSLDQLPNEVAHLLQEIRQLDLRVQELQQENDKESARYIRHSLKASNSASSSASPSASPAPAVPRPPSPKSQAIPPKIAANYDEIHLLSAQKVALAQRIIDLVTRTQARLDAELIKVRILQGELVPDPLSRTNSLVAPIPDGDVYIGASRNPVSQMSEREFAKCIDSIGVGVGYSSTNGLAVACLGQLPLRPTAAEEAPSHGYQLYPNQAQPSASASNAAAAQPKRSRLSRQIHPREEMDLDGDGEEEGEGEGEGEDENLYCFCQKQSYGDMIACDNNDCPYEWFHLSCVSLTQPTPDQWYCSECLDKGFGGGRKARKR